MTFLNSSNRRAVTLLELILAIVLMSLIVLGFTSINTFSRQNVIMAGNRAKLQNSITFVLEHMGRNIARAIGDVNNPPVSFPVTDNCTDSAIRIRIDSDNDGMLNTSTDKLIDYSYNITNKELRYYSNYTNCSNCSVSCYEVIANKITSNLNTTYVTYSNTSNYITIDLSGRWDPTNSTISPTNPQVNMTSVTQMPSVSVN